MIVAPSFTCEVVRVHDGDGPLWCRSGERVRIAGVQAPDYESAEPCRTGRAEYTCDDAAADRARAVTTRLTLRQRLTCRPVEQSYGRVVATCRLPDGRRLECAVIAAGAAARWDRYWRRYWLEPCRG